MGLADEVISVRVVKVYHLHGRKEGRQAGREEEGKEERENRSDRERVGLE